MNSSSIQPTSRRRCQGILLVECVVYFGIFLTVTGLAYAAYFRCLDNFRALRRNANDIAKVLHAGERWRQDVRSATALPQYDVEGEETRLRLPQPNGEITYGYCRGIVWRKAGAQARLEVVLPKVKHSRMLDDNRGPVVVCRWELELEPGHKVVRVTPLFTFEAVARSRL